MRVVGLNEIIHEVDALDEALRESIMPQTEINKIEAEKRATEFRKTMGGTMTVSVTDISIHFPFLSARAFKASFFFKASIALLALYS